MRVVIVKGKDIIKRTFVALKRLNPKLPEKGKIIIKPNLVEPMSNDSGAITRKEVVEGIIRFLDDKNYNIFIGEGSSIYDTKKCFEKASYYKLKEKYDIKLIDLNQSEFIPINGRYWNFEIAKIIKSSYIISAAVLKEHGFTVTLSLKNIMGVLRPQKSYPTKEYMHKENDPKIWAERLCDLVRVAKPNLAVIDATTAMYGCHLYGRLKKLNLTLVSEDALACDIVGARLLGYEKVFYLELIKKEFGDREIKIEKIKLD